VEKNIANSEEVPVRLKSLKHKERNPTWSTWKMVSFITWSRTYFTWI